MNASATAIIVRNTTKQGRYDVPLPPTPVVYCTEPLHRTQEAYRLKLLDGLNASTWSPIARSVREYRGRQIWTACSRFYAAAVIAARSGYVELRRDVDGTGAVLMARLVGGGML